MNARIRRVLGRVFIVLTVALLTFGVLAILLAPTFVRWHVERKYPGVKIGDVEIEWMTKELVFYDVEVHRDGIDAKLKKVTATETSAKIEGGDVEITLSDKASGETSTTKITITATGLDAVVKKDDVIATLRGMSLDSEKVCFSTGTIEHPLAKADVENGCAMRDKSRVTADRVLVPVTLPVEIPRVFPTQLIVATGIDVDLKNEAFSAKTIDVGPFAVQEPKVKLEPNDHLMLYAKKITVDHPWVAPQPVWFEGVSVIAPVSLKDGLGSVAFIIGEQVFHVNPKEQSIDGGGDCAHWVDVLPKPLPKALEGAKEHFTGTLVFDFRVKPVPSLKVSTNCKYACSASPIKEVRSRVFTYDVYDAKNNIVERKTGPGTAGWVSLSELPPHIARSFILLEDPGFETHKGVLPKALENSLKLNIEEGEFMRGGSTITMQLAKNLWLRRHKTIGRKAQEALLTFALESCMSKSQILELYLNVIEFGPNVYGIGAGARHYFKKHASALTPEESFFLASILPAPRKANPRDLSKVKNIMRALARSGYISELMVETDSDPVDTSGWEVDP